MLELWKREKSSGNHGRLTKSRSEGARLGRLSQEEKLQHVTRGQKKRKIDKRYPGAWEKRRAGKVEGKRDTKSARMRKVCLWRYGQNLPDGEAPPWPGKRSRILRTPGLGHKLKWRTMTTPPENRDNLRTGEKLVGCDISFNWRKEPGQKEGPMRTT